jgi:hypothetical protein
MVGLKLNWQVLPIQGSYATRICARGFCKFSTIFSSKRNHTAAIRPFRDDSYRVRLLYADLNAGDWTAPHSRLAWPCSFPRFLHFLECLRLVPPTRGPQLPRSPSVGCLSPHNMLSEFHRAWSCLSRLRPPHRRYARLLWRTNLNSSAAFCAKVSRGKRRNECFQVKLYTDMLRISPISPQVSNFGILPTTLSVIAVKMGVFNKRKLIIADDTVTNAAGLTLRQSAFPNILGKRLVPISLTKCSRSFNCEKSLFCSSYGDSPTAYWTSLTPTSSPP